MKLNDASVKKLSGVHLDLVRVINRAAFIGPGEFVVTEGLRDIERQRQLVAEGKSRTMHSRHLTGHAVDLAAVVAGKVTWDWAAYEKLAAQVKEAARLEGVPIEWGGDWVAFRDGPHFQLPVKVYP